MEVNDKAMLAKDSLTSDDRIIGKHVFGNLYDIDEAILSDKEFLEELVREAVKIAKMSLVEIKAWSFGGVKGACRS
ncbi:hypothetical protein HS1genome_1138 [Sulfodiicoccus acidiphilus]|uniref:Uncharacterized protein n=1 Tax=Sulfodiicoccus acidiphilus TaxID=1670455 RepID=A0A348B3J7_9CREN|nr:hypothetical protein HS1genome_1138 [Sulfodiicoccus acidiphilus]